MQISRTLDSNPQDDRSNVLSGDILGGVVNGGEGGKNLISEEIRAETWTPELLSSYLDEAKTHLRFMLAYDWNERVKPEMDSASLEEFYAVTSLGARRKHQGRNVGILDNNTVYRTAAGSVFSVPAADK